MFRRLDTNANHIPSDGKPLSHLYSITHLPGV